MSGANKRRKRREGLWRRQQGLCHWCKTPMIHWNDRANDPSKKAKGESHKRWATINHLRPRHHPHRLGPANGEQRWVLACWKCNNDRDRAAVMAIPIEERWLAAKAFPQDAPRPYFVRPARDRHSTVSSQDRVNP